MQAVAAMVVQQEALPSTVALNRGARLFQTISTVVSIDDAPNRQKYVHTKKTAYGEHLPHSMLGLVIVSQRVSFAELASLAGKLMEDMCPCVAAVHLAPVH